MCLTIDIMKCFLCKGDTVKSTTTYMTAYKNCYIIIKNVHSVVKSLLMAPQCKKSSPLYQN